MGRFEAPGAGQRPIEFHGEPGTIILQNCEFLILIATGGIGGCAPLGSRFELSEGRRKAPQGGVEICRQTHISAIRFSKWATIWRNDRLKVNELHGFVHRTNEL
jgi:hypothetical protein